MTTTETTADEALPATATPVSSPVHPPGMHLMDPEEWRLQRASHVFRSAESFRWFTRQNRDELVSNGALVAPAGRYLVQVEIFEAAVMRIGRRLAETLRR